MDRGYCFVVMPFADQYRSLYERAIIPAVNEECLDCRRADDSLVSANIMNEVISRIDKARVVIAVLDTLNPNVMYELGVAHALGRPTISLLSKAIDIPFDMKGYRHITYNDEKHLRKRLGEALSDTIKGGIDNLSNPVVDALGSQFPFRATVSDIKEIEAKATGEVWIIGPDCAIDIPHYSDVMKRNLCERAIKYKYILAKSGKRSWLDLTDYLSVPRQYISNLTAKFVSDDSIESDLVIYNPRMTQELKVYLKPAQTSSDPFYIRLDTARGVALQKRFDSLWHRRKFGLL